MLSTGALQRSTHTPSGQPPFPKAGPLEGGFGQDGSLRLDLCGDTGQPGSPGEDIALSERMRQTLSPQCVDGLVLWRSCLFLGVTGALSTVYGVQPGRDESVLAQLCLSLREELSGPQTHRSRSPLLSTPSSKNEA